RNCQFSGSTKWRICRMCKYPANEEDRRCLNSHDVDEVGRWTVARWIPGGSTGVRQGGQHDAMVRKVPSKLKEGSVIRSRNNGEKEKEEMRGNLTSCSSLFSHP
ncbi:hypothetical protein ALC56_09421, partial [Trachymyrmex septentrionalis]